MLLGNKSKKSARTHFLLGNVACNNVMSLSVIRFDVMVNSVGATMATILISKKWPGE